MKAILQDRYSSPDVLELQDLEKPLIGDGEVLLRVEAAAVNPIDYFALQGGAGRIFYGLRKPRQRVRGLDVAGHIEAVGKDVQRLRPGDQVFGECKGCRGAKPPPRSGDTFVDVVQPVQD